MEDNVGKSRSNIGWGIPVSVIAHLLFAVVAIVGLPLELPQPPEEEAVTVEIVEPPPEPEPVPEPEPELEPQPEPPPEPEEQETEPEPAPQPEPPPETEPELEQAPESPSGEQAPPPAPTLRPVFEFGEETTGPKASPDGNASMEGTTRPQEADEPEAAEEEGGSETPEILAGAPNEDMDPIAPEPAPPSASEEISKSDEAEEPAEEVLPTLPEAKTIFSEDMTDDPVARIAMGDLPRNLRATQLCETELTEQLRHASPPRNPDFIPRSPLSEGVILELRETAFRAGGRWYNLSFRCEINGDATKVVSFAFDIGDPVPQSEWRARGFPGF